MCAQSGAVVFNVSKHEIRFDVCHVNADCTVRKAVTASPSMLCIVLKDEMRSSTCQMNAKRKKEEVDAPCAPTQRKFSAF